MVLGGDLNVHDQLSRSHVTRILPNGAIDSSFVPATVNGFVLSIAVQSDNKVLIGGDFESVGGITRNGLARLNADGSLDTSFDIGTGFIFLGNQGGRVHHLLLLPDGKVLCAGSWTSFNGLGGPNIIRLNTDGSLDTSFDPGTGFNGSVTGLRLQPDGKVLVSGWFNEYNGTSRECIARLMSNGALDTGFAPTFSGGQQSFALDLRPDGKIWLQGNFTTVSGIPRHNFVLLTSNGTVDPSFDPPALPYDYVNTIAGQANGGLLVGHYINEPNGETYDYMIRFNPDGTLDSQFMGDDFNSVIEEIHVMPDQKIVVLGAFGAYKDRGECGFTRLLPDGSVDPEWVQASSFDHNIFSILRQYDGKFIVTGSFYAHYDRAVNQVARLHNDGSLDTTFIATGRMIQPVLDAAVQSNGKVVVVGNFYNEVDTTFSSNCLRLNADGSMDTTFHSPDDLPQNTSRVLLQNDGKVLVLAGGRLRRLMADGSEDLSFTSLPATSGLPSDILLLPNGKIMVVGGFNDFLGSPANGIVRLMPDGTVDPSFYPGTGANGMIKDIERQPDGMFLIAGYFSNYNGVNVPGIARIQANGALDTSFNPGAGPNGAVTCIAMDPFGKIYIGGLFTEYAGVPRNRLARLLGNGLLDSAFDPGTGLNGGMNDIAFDLNGEPVIVGSFTSYNNIGRNRITRIFGSLTTSVAEQDLSQELYLFPNPAHDVLNIRSSKKDLGGRWRLMDANSRNLETRMLSPCDQIIWPVAHLPGGHYHLEQIRDDGTKRILKLVKE